MQKRENPFRKAVRHILADINNYCHLPVADIHLIVRKKGNKMKPLRKKIFIDLTKGLILLFLLTMLILEAFLTASYVKYDTSVIYTAIITTLCWLLIGCLFMSYSSRHYIFLAIITATYFGFYYLNDEINLAHQQERCLDLGNIWNKEQNKCH